MKVSVVIAAYDERENIEVLARRLDRVLRDLAPVPSEIIFVVEGRDGTKEVIERLSQELGGIQLLYQETPSGLGNAFRRGFADVSPDADYVITMDADLNHKPEEIPRLLEEICRRDLDVLVGSRFVAGSRSEGIPLWKRVLSGLMNRLIGSLFDVEVLDKTSGFRIYRASVLRLLTSYRNNDFAFLPEILIHAQDQGLRVGEAPIHFTFRTRGESKMSLLQTSRSYLALLRTRFDAWSLAALSFLCLGIAVRVLYAFPVHKFAADADSLLTGLRAFDIQNGDLRVFYSYLRIGALESYMHIPAYAFLGVSRETISLAPLLSSVLTLVFFFFFVRELFGRQAGCFALLFFAFPPPAYIGWTYMPNGYSETLLFCAATLYFAARLARTGSTRFSPLALGLSAGLGFWNSLQTLGCTVPALLWLLLRRRELVRRPGFLLATGSGFVIGASPWILFNIRYPLASLRETSAIQPAHGLRQVLENTWYFLTDNVPVLTVGFNPYDTFRSGKAMTELQGILRWPSVVILALAAVGLILLSLAHQKSNRTRRTRFPRYSLLLLWLVAAAVAGTSLFSQAGQARGLTVRYVLPLYIVIAAALGLLVSLVWRRSRNAAVAASLVLVVFYFSGYFMPWTSYRKLLRELATFDSQLLGFLEAHHVRWVCGNYWVVYPLVFLSRQRVLGVPFQANHDHYNYSESVSGRSTRWALVGRDANWLRVWAGRAGLEGRTVPAGSGYHVFLPSGEERSARSPRKTIALLQETAPWGH